MPGSVPEALSAEVPGLPAHRRGTWVPCSMPAGETGVPEALPAAVPSGWRGTRMPGAVSATVPGEVPVPSDAVGKGC